MKFFKSSDRMFWRLLLKSVQVQRGRAVTATLAMTVAAAVATALLGLYTDIGAKLNTEFRKFGANAVVVAQNAKSLSPQTLAKIHAALGPNDVSAPFAYVVAKTASGRPIVVAGTDFAVVKRLDSWWSVTQWPNHENEALIGTRAASTMQEEGQNNTLMFSGKSYTFAAAGQLTTGGPEDSRIYLSLPDFEQWTGVAPSTVELALQGSPEDVSASINRLKNVLAGEPVTVQPVRQIVEGETRVLGKTRSILLLTSILIATMVTLCVVATLTASVLERRKDYAVMKALGSSQKKLDLLFLTESLILAMIGSVLGFVLGSGIAAWIGRANFHAAVVPRFSVFPAVLFCCVIISVIGAVLPLVRLQKLQPAVMLKGD